MKYIFDNPTFVRHLLEEARRRFPFKGTTSSVTSLGTPSSDDSVICSDGSIKNFPSSIPGREVILPGANGGCYLCGVDPDGTIVWARYKAVDHSHAVEVAKLCYPPGSIVKGLNRLSVRIEKEEHFRTKESVNPYSFFVYYQNAKLVSITGDGIVHWATTEQPNEKTFANIEEVKAFVSSKIPVGMFYWPLTDSGTPFPKVPRTQFTKRTAEKITDFNLERAIGSYSDKGYMAYLKTTDYPIKESDIVLAQYTTSLTPEESTKKEPSPEETIMFDTLDDLKAYIENRYPKGTRYNKLFMSGHPSSMEDRYVTRNENLRYLPGIKDNHIHFDFHNTGYAVVAKKSTFPMSLADIEFGEIVQSEESEQEEYPVKATQLVVAPRLANVQNEPSVIPALAYPVFHSLDEVRQFLSVLYHRGVTYIQVNMYGADTMKSHTVVDTDLSYRQLTERVVFDFGLTETNGYVAILEKVDGAVRYPIKLNDLILAKRVLSRPQVNTDMQYPVTPAEALRRHDVKAISTQTMNTKPVSAELRQKPKKKRFNTNL